MKNLYLIIGAVFLATSAMAADPDCGKIKTATYESFPGVQMESGKAYIIEGQAASSAVAVADAQGLEICVYGISGDRAGGVRFKH
jgi:hypothetical protein